MKALTLTQPWATLVALGAKQMETRSWSTKYRGAFAIHAAHYFLQEAKDLVFTEPFYSALNRQIDERHSEFPALPCGAIIAVCELVDCIRVLDKQVFFGVRADSIVRLPPDEPECSLGNYSPGRYAWILTNIRAMNKPIPAKGTLSLWEMSPNLVKQIEAQL